ncbi:tetratricopeptide repeat protein [Streptomyces sp. NPDC003023]|uniref:tetratricopeptide repeat protein n=1 Tax=Streptomyces sp. NPDC003023 TaxID=3364675 RepID=UPI0036A7EE9C
MLARIQFARGRTPSAVELMADVVARRGRSLGADHPFTAASRDLLGQFGEGRS